MACCINPNCQNPLYPDSTKVCEICGTQLVLLKNRYRPIKPLGRGGFGQTYLAEDVDKLNELCVIKQFAPNFQGSWAIEKGKELFEQEARRLQQLGENPQIPTLFAYFEEDNYLYLVQQYIEGQTLDKELAQKGVFSEPEIWKLLFELLDILKCVHQKQVIHRDIKLDNIIHRQSDGKFVLIDFGVAKQLTQTSMGELGTTIGSFGYVSIEQMEGGSAYPSSDLYSLGVTCFHLLSGIHPKELWNKQGYGWVSVWQEYLQQTLSQELIQIIDRLLQPNHQERYQSAEEVLRDLNTNSQTVPLPGMVSSVSPSVVPSTEKQPSVSPSVIPSTENRLASLPNKSLLLLITGVSIGVAVAVAFSFLTRTPQLREAQTIEPQPMEPQLTVEPNPININISVVSTVSGLDYALLRNLLAAGDWKEADEETARVMIQATNRENFGWLTREDIDNFYCEDLRLIDQLWLEYSEGTFGFSVQKEIYQQLGGTREYNDQTWSYFAERVGWRSAEEEWLSYEELHKSIAENPEYLLPGQLPHLILRIHQASTEYSQFHSGLLSHNCLNL